MLAPVTAFEPQPTGTGHRVTAWLMCGPIPCIIYGSITAIFDDCILLTAGLILLGVDMIARTALDLTAASHSDLPRPVWLCTVLLPAGRLIVKLFSGLSCKPGSESASGSHCMPSGEKGINSSQHQAIDNMIDKRDDWIQ